MRPPVKQGQRSQRDRLKAPSGGRLRRFCRVVVLAKGYGHCRRTTPCSSGRSHPQSSHRVIQRLPSLLTFADINISPSAKIEQGGRLADSPRVRLAEAP